MVTRSVSESSTVYGVLYSKFEFAVQDVIKTPKLKPRSRKRVLGRVL